MSEPFELKILPGAETWRPIPSTGGVYEASNSGEVRRAASRRVLVKCPDTRGYWRVGLSINGVQRSRPNHVLVAEAFLGPRPPGMDVCHNDSDRKNSRAENLRYGTHKENMADYAAIRPRETHCKNGHEFTEQNTYRAIRSQNGRAQRQCRECCRLRAESRRRRDGRARRGAYGPIGPYGPRKKGAA